ncbi:MAG: hypothetical protein QXL94_04360, partial [Candidatus Parvarchaeum sp.]
TIVDKQHQEDFFELVCPYCRRNTPMRAIFTTQYTANCVFDKEAYKRGKYYIFDTSDDVEYSTESEQGECECGECAATLFSSANEEAAVYSVFGEFLRKINSKATTEAFYD